ncbi:MAG TPA: Wzz/FepE/Etk N-terminal domain-containing protein [Candidatus Kapabacteria bacterium]|nr:Wzz/FepE/Etk N-terminal domain-containing protein [Candidatus Kapabacteria bacterium]
MADQSEKAIQEMEPARKAWVESMALLFRHKTLIIATTVAVTLITTIYIFFFAKTWYKAQANVFPARKPGGLLDNLTSGITSTIKDLGLTPLAGKSKNDGTYSPIAIAASRTVQESLIKEFDLIKVYDVKTMDDAAKEFSEHVSVDVLEEGNVGVSFEDTDPNRAAAVANRIVDKMNEVNSNLAMEEAKFNKTYIEKRFNKILSDLDETDSALGIFQRKYGVYELKTQAQAQLTVLGTLEQQRYLSEVQLANAEQLYGSESPEANTIRTSLSELRSKLDDLKTGMDKDAKSYFVPTDVMPDVALQYLRLMREEEIQSKLKAFLMPSYEQAKMDESKQTLLYLTLDKATPPLKKSRPKRSITVLVALLGSFVLTCLAVIGAARVSEARVRFRRDRQRLGV